MDALRPTQVTDHSISDARQRPLRVDPNYPLPTSIPPIRKMEKSHTGDSGQNNGLIRSTSRKRRHSGAGQAQYESFPKPGPEAPEVPSAPPISYREPYAAAPADTPPYKDPTSFAARARGAPNDVTLLPDSPIEGNFEVMAETTRQNRRGSIRRSSIPKPAGAHTSPPQRDSASFKQPTSPRTPNITTNSRVSNNPNNASTQSAGNTNGNEEYMAKNPSQRRVSASGADPRKEWAVDRSPLQKLEGKLIDISKEEKRARVEEAEQLLKERRRGSAHEQRKSNLDSLKNQVEARQDRGDAERRGSHRQSTRGVSIDDVGNSRDMPGTSFDPRRERIVQSDEPTHTRRKQGEPSSSASGAPNGASKHGETYTEQGSPLDRPIAQPKRQDTTPRKGDVRFAPQEKSAAADRPNKQVPKQQKGLYDHKAQSSGDEDSLADYGGPSDPVPPRAVQSKNPDLAYQIPPQTAAGVAARKIVGFGGQPEQAEPAPAQRHHRLSKLLHRHKAEGPPAHDSVQQPRHIDDWRKASTARLTAADFATIPKSIVDAPNKYNAWWDKDQFPRRSIANGGSTENDVFLNARCEPPLYLKCGPLLRFTGIQRSKLQPSQSHRSSSAMDREIWRGSIMIVTTDSQSDYNTVPVLDIFPEPMDTLPPPPQQAKIEGSGDLPDAYLDPVAGLPKLTRHGEVVYVRPVEDLDHECDLSRVESDDGLFEQTRTANVPTSYGRPNSVHGVTARSSAGQTKAGRRSSQKSGEGRVKAARLHAERGVTFWRFNIEVELTERQQRIGYRINKSASVGFWVPARGQTMNMMFHSCNGFSMSVDPNTFSGPDPLWRDVLNNHQSRPFHVMIGGGDQIYNDRVMSETRLFQDWLSIKNPHHKHQTPFSIEMRDELEEFYLERYSMWFSQGLFGMANSQIPMINVWDDHDIIDGFGSYPHHFMSTPVFCGLGAVAFKYYMLFQHQSVVEEGPAEEPSWLMGAAPGPYINELSRSLFLNLGKNVAFLGLDCRTERMRDEILSEATYDAVFERCRREVIEGETKHLIVLLGVPIAYPRLNFLENVLTSRVMDPIKALGRTGLLGGFLNKFDGGVEILDDLDDHWTAKYHKQERNWFIQELQELAAEKSIRVTILGGDVHLAAIGQFYSSPQLNIPKDRDHRYMPNVISSAIVNTPPPEMMADILNKRDKKHYLDKEDKQTLEDMIPMFTHDVDGKGRNNKRLLPRRNWCSIREYQPGSTPPPTPPESELSLRTEDSPQPQPSRLQRTLSLTRGDVKPGNLIRRLSGRARAPSPDYPLSNQYRSSPRTPTSPPQSHEDYFTHEPKRASTLPAPYTNGVLRHSSAPLARPGNFHRRPTNLSEKAILKGGADTNSADDEKNGHINLEHGLDICINCEVNQKDPAGITVPYRLLVPALSYSGPEDINQAAYRKKGVIERFRSIKVGRGGKSGLAKRQGQGEWGGGGTDSYTPSVSEVGEQQYPVQQQQQQARPIISNPMPLQDKGYPGRRLSKADRMLGTMDPPAPSTTNGAGHNGDVVDGQSAQITSSAGTAARGGVAYFPHRPRRDTLTANDRSSNAHPASSPETRPSGGNVILGQGAKISSAGSRAAGPQGLQTGNGSVKMGVGEKVRSVSGSVMRSGSRGYQPAEGREEGVVLGRGEKVSSGGRFGGRRSGGGDVEVEDEEYYSDEGGDRYEGGHPVARNGDGKGRGYGGIEAYKEKSWRRFF